MKQNRTSRPHKLVALLAGAALLGLVSQGAAAATAAGTSVTNIAKLSYSVNGNAQNEICSSPTGNSTGNGGTSGTTCTDGANGAGNTAFVVDNKINLSVAEVGGSATTVLPGATGAITTFTVTNNGNAAQGYTLSATNATGNPTVFTVADNIQASAFQVFVDDPGAGGTAGVYDAAFDTATDISSLAAGSSATVFVLATIPSVANNGDQAVVTLTATTTVDGNTASAVSETATADTAGVDIVFADPANTISDPLAANTARDAIGIAQDAYRVGSAIITVTKTVTPVCDPFNGTTNPKNIPGAYVQYAITIKNTGTAPATLSAVTDGLNAATAFDAELISGAAGTGAACATVASGGTSLSASGFGAVTGAGAGPGVTAPGSAAHETTAGAAHAAGVVSVNFGTLSVTPTTFTPMLSSGSLAAGNYITVYFNTIVQ
ncbi:MAG: hypothetical protein IPM27_00890 [Nitrosomonadales bacterium]|nr:hypothetical protein [Nitrosomonadales bacterium]